MPGEIITHPYGEGPPRSPARHCERSDAIQSVLDCRVAVRRWSWPGPTGKPVYNYRAEGRDFRQGRCLIVVLERKDWTRWLDPEVPAAELLGPLPAGSLNVAPN